MIQYTSTCARWDPDVTYTLCPPGCTVTDREFVVRYDVNAAGLRDDDASLAAPRVIVVGDSYAMGWGVTANDSFPQRLEQRLGMRVLNAGVPSYGTARELRLLRRLDRSAVGALVIQYCWNDNAENRSWVEQGGNLDTLSREAYGRLVAQHADSLRYYPFKHAVTLLGVLRARWSPAGHEVVTAGDPVAQAAQDFLTVLAGHEPLLNTTPVIVLATCSEEAAFSGALRDALATDRWPRLTTRVTVVDPTPRLRPEHIYPLDGHWTAAGHEMAAELLAEELSRRMAR